MFPFDLFIVPEWIAALVAGVAFGLNLGAYVARRKYRRMLNLYNYSDAALVELVDWALVVMKERKDERDLVDCSAVHPSSDAHEDAGQSGSGATGSIPACGAGDEGSNPSSGTMPEKETS